MQLRQKSKQQRYIQVSKGCGLVSDIRGRTGYVSAGIFSLLLASVFILCSVCSSLKSCLTTQRETTAPTSKKKHQSQRMKTKWAYLSHCGGGEEVTWPGWGQSEGCSGQQGFTLAHASMQLRPDSNWLRWLSQTGGSRIFLLNRIVPIDSLYHITNCMWQKRLIRSTFETKRRSVINKSHTVISVQNTQKMHRSLFDHFTFQVNRLFTVSESEREWASFWVSVRVSESVSDWVRFENRTNYVTAVPAFDKERERWWEEEKAKRATSQWANRWN